RCTGSICQNIRKPHEISKTDVGLCEASGDNCHRDMIVARQVVCQPLGSCHHLTDLSRAAQGKESPRRRSSEGIGQDCHLSLASHSVLPPCFFADRPPSKAGSLLVQRDTARGGVDS